MSLSFFLLLGAAVISTLAAIHLAECVRTQRELARRFVSEILRTRGRQTRISADGLIRFCRGMRITKK